MLVWCNNNSIVEIKNFRQNCKIHDPVLNSFIFYGFDLVLFYFTFLGELYF